MVLSIRRAASSCAKICKRRMLLRGLPFVPPRRERHVIGDPNLCRCTQGGRRVGWCCFAHHVDRQPSSLPICVRYSEEVADSSIGLEGCLHHRYLRWALTFDTSGLARCYDNGTSESATSLPPRGYVCDFLIAHGYLRDDLCMDFGCNRLRMFLHVLPQACHLSRIPEINSVQSSSLC